MMAWFLFILMVGAVVAYCVWDYRRKSALREAASQERLMQLLEAKAAAKPAADAPPAGIPAVAGNAPAQAPPVAAAVPSGKERFLGKAETLVYYLLKTGIPDHEVFANVTLAAVVGQEGGGFNQEQQLKRFSQHQLDFVICDKSMRIVAVVEVELPGGTDTTGTQRFKSDTLKAAGVRLVLLNPKSMPRREGIRALVCGGAVAAGS